MNWADWAIIAIVVVSALISVIRGFFREALSVATWIVALVVAMTFHQSASTLLVNQIETASLRLIVAWVGLFVLTLIVGGLINFIISRLVKISGLGGTDRFLGMLFGLARGLIVVLVILILLSGILPVKVDRWWHESLLIPWFLKFEDVARNAGATLFEWLKQLF